MVIRLATVGFVAATIAHTPAAGQDRAAGAVPDRPLVVIARRNLSFGTVFPGIPTSVASNHPRLSGEFEIQGTRGLPVRFEFLLPAALTAAGGATLPVAFANTDGSFHFSRGLAHRSLFDPHGPVTAALGPNGELHVWLGGTVSPARGQTSGTYIATISITVFNLGI
jgi:hypothetical protein